MRSVLVAGLRVFDCCGIGIIPATVVFCLLGCFGYFGVACIVEWVFCAYFGVYLLILVSFCWFWCFRLFCVVVVILCFLLF